MPEIVDWREPPEIVDWRQPPARRRLFFLILAVLAVVVILRPDGVTVLRGGSLVRVARLPGCVPNDTELEWTVFAAFTAVTFFCFVRMVSGAEVGVPPRFAKG
jgi:hypothetical protein